MADTASAADSAVVTASASEGTRPSPSSDVAIAESSDIKRSSRSSRREKDELPVVARGGLRDLLTSPLYLLLLLLRFAAIFLPGYVDNAELLDGQDVLAAALLPGMPAAAASALPAGMAADPPVRSMVGAVITTGIPYMAVNLLSRSVPLPPHLLGVVGVVAPRLWMALLSVLMDLLTLNLFNHNEQHAAVPTVMTLASAWTTFALMTRNTNFALEALCVAGVIAACFVGELNNERPLYYLTALAMSLGIFLRPMFIGYTTTIIIFLLAARARPEFSTLRYVRGAIEGTALFGIMCTLYVTVDSVFHGLFKLTIGGVPVTSFDSFVSLVGTGPLAYKGSLVITPLQAILAYWRGWTFKTFQQNASPGQIFISLPFILGPLFFLLARDSYEGTRKELKGLAAELKAASNGGGSSATTTGPSVRGPDGKKRRRRRRAPSAAKVREEETLVFYDTIQTTLLLGLLFDVVQHNDRIGLVSLLPLVMPAVVCAHEHIFAPDSRQWMRYAWLASTVVAVVSLAGANHGALTRTALALSAGERGQLPSDAQVVVYRGLVPPAVAFGMNPHGATFHDGGLTRTELMSKLKKLRAADTHEEDKLLVVAPGTVRMKRDLEEAPEMRMGFHMSLHDPPTNVDDVLRRTQLRWYRFVGDEDDSIILDAEEDAEREEEL